MDSAKEETIEGQVESEIFKGPDNYSFKLLASLNGSGDNMGESFSVTLFNVSNKFDPILNWPAKFTFDIILVHPQLDNKKYTLTHSFHKCGYWWYDVTTFALLRSSWVLFCIF